MNNELESKIKRIRNLKQNQNKSEEEIIALAKQQLEKETIINGLAFCIGDEEKDYANKLLEEVLNEASITSISDRDTLKQFIDNSILIERIKAEIKKEYEKGNPSIPLKMSEELRSLQDLNYTLKERLGLTKKESQDVLEEWNKLKEKAINYYKEHAGCNVARCPYCKKLFMILKDMRGHTTEKIPIFKKTLLYNKKLFEKFEKQESLTLDDMMEILGVSADYIYYVLEKVYKNEKK